MKRVMALLLRLIQKYERVSLGFSFQLCLLFMDFTFPPAQTFGMPIFEFYNVLKSNLFNSISICSRHITRMNSLIQYLAIQLPREHGMDRTVFLSGRGTTMRLVIA